jgi:formylglycine-generating enzyme required for sulfatase activity
MRHWPLELLLFVSAFAGCRAKAQGVTLVETPMAPSGSIALASERVSPPAARATAAPAAEPEPGSTTTPAGMFPVPEGSFMMGADEGGEPDERPAHLVTVRGFWLDTTEVTNAAYARCVEASACRPHSPRNAASHGLDDRTFRSPRQPVSGVSWDDALGYCRWVEKRLPTEAEFERASRGEDGRRYPWGSEPPRAELVVFGTSVTHEVGAHPRGAGPYGHLDLAGNVWEWIADEYDPYAYRRASAPEGKPGECAEILAAQNELRRAGQQGFTGSNPIPTECEHVLRGGAFNSTPAPLRTMNRVHHPGRFRLVMSGFRCAKDR